MVSETDDIYHMIYSIRYIQNLFMSCKPYALVSLWTDTIPPPGKQQHVHMMLKEKLENKEIRINPLAIDTSLATSSPASPSDDGIAVEMQTLPSVPAEPQSDPTSPSLLDEADDVRPDISAQSGSSDELSVDEKEVKSNESEKKPTINTNTNTNTVELNGEAGRTGGMAGIDTEDIKKKRKMKTQLTFRAVRARNLELRYKAYKFEYVDVDPKEYDSFSDTVMETFSAFLTNYEQYWLNVYRPFDEYDIEANITSTNILYGFQWLRMLCNCDFGRKNKNKERRSTVKIPFGQLSTREKCKKFTSALWKMCKWFMDNFCM